MLSAAVIPELAYADPLEAGAWLCRAFGFSERLRIGNHRVQLTYGDGCIVARDERDHGAGPPSVPAQRLGHSIIVRVLDADHHFAQARAAGALILSEPTSHVYGERQYTAVDLGGHVWTFSQSIADIDPAEWGGELVTG
jgi:uncharacterized glyoxalase superfamily protein PhnB